MLSLIKADMHRVLRKKSFLLTLVFLPVILFLQTAIHSEDPVEEFITGVQGRMNGLIMLIITLVIYLAVFADDHRSRSIVTVIGRGLSRRKVFAAKLIDCLLCSALLFVFAMALQTVFADLMSVPLSSRQIFLLRVYVIVLIARSVGCLSFSMLAQYLTDSTAMGVITDVIAALILANVLNLARTLLEIDFYSYSMSGLLEAAYNNFAVGRLPWQILPAVLVYIAAPVLAAAAVNQKKEMDL
ncbi:MAG: hypothetical protein E7238_07605 [Sarcina sp.]|nr:hypothetical protein [Sarcina sp.]